MVVRGTVKLAFVLLLSGKSGPTFWKKSSRPCFTPGTGKRILNQPQWEADGACSGGDLVAKSCLTLCHPWDWKIPRRRKWQPTSVFSPEKSHGQGWLWLRTWIWSHTVGSNLALLFPGSVTSSKLLHFSKPQFSHQRNGITLVPTSLGCYED